MSEQRRIAIVTGAGGEIGFETAIRPVRRGYAVPKRSEDSQR